MGIFSKLAKKIFELKTKIKNIFIKERYNYIRARILDSSTGVFKNTSIYSENNVYREILTLFFTLLFLIIVSFYVYIDLKENMVKNKVGSNIEPLKIVVQNPANLNIIQDYNINKYKIKSGDTILDILTNSVGISIGDAYQVIGELNKHYDIRRLKVGQELFLKYKTDIESDNNNVSHRVILYEFRVKDINREKEIVVARGDDGSYKASMENLTLVKHYTKYTITINSSMYVDAVEAGVPANIVMNLIMYYSFDIDFQRDIMPKDYFEVLYETYYTEEGERVKDGEIIFADLKAKGEHHNIYRYNTQKHGDMYFNENGVSAKKSLLKTPIDGARISSGFNPRRKHPVLGYTKAHQGIDFAAPIGTPFYAAGDGVVTTVSLGWSGGYGNMVKIRHNENYETLYAHSSRIASGIKKGVRVKQGQVIAYVGATGRVTGPHLHYEIIYKGQKINPSSVRSVATIKLSGRDLMNYNDHRNRIDSYRKNTPNQNINFIKLLN